MPYFPNITYPPAGGGSVTLPYLTGVTVVPTAITMSAGSTQFYASGTLSGTNGISTGVLANSFLSWSSGDTAYVTVSQAGLATWVSGTSAGQTVYVTASALGNVQGTVSLLAKQAAAAYLIPESGTVKFHVYTTGTTLIDTVGTNTWNVTNNPTWNAASGTWPFPKSWTGGGTAFTAASDYIRNNQPFIFAGIFALSAGGGEYIMNSWDNNGGWGIYTTGEGGKCEIVRYNGGLAAAVAVNGIAGVGKPQLVVGGFDGTTWYMRVNGSALASQAVSAPAVGASSGLKMCDPYTNKVAEFYVSALTPTSASIAALYNAVSSALNGAVP